MLPCTYKQKHNICIFKKNTCISYNVWSIIFWKTCLICCDFLSSAGSGAHSGEHPVLSGCPLSVRGWAGVSRVAPGHLRGHAVEEAHWEDGAHWSTVERPVWKTSVVSWRMWMNCPWIAFSMLHTILMFYQNAVLKILFLSKELSATVGI